MARSGKTLRSRAVQRRRKVRKKRMLRNKVRHHHHRRYAGVRGARGRKKTVRRLKVKHITPTAKRKSYRAAPSGSGLPPISMSTYMSMF